MKKIQQGILVYEYLLCDCFFQSDSNDIRKSNVKVWLTVAKIDDIFNFTFKFNGTVVIPCSRCLDDMDFCIDVVSHLVVKIGKEFSEESEEIVIVSEMEGCIDVAGFLYESVILAIPIRHVHFQGQCNQQTLTKLKDCEVKIQDLDYAMETLV